MNGTKERVSRDETMGRIPGYAYCYRASAGRAA